MGFKTGLAVGLGVGYVLGTKAGERRFEQLRSTWSRVSESPSIQRVSERARGLATEGTRRGMDAVQDGLDRAGTTVKERLGREDGTTDRIVDLNKAGSEVGDAVSGAAEAAERTLSDLSDAVPEVPRTP